MKLRNKKTGEIIETVIVDHGAEWEIRNVCTNEDAQIYNSLAELNEEWEDVPEEPKEYWFIDIRYPKVEPKKDINLSNSMRKRLKEIGNYFETKEEAEKAVEKLKAWKRLKDKGFRFTLTPGVGSLDIAPGKYQIEISADMPAKWFCCDAVQEDLDLLFGGEE